MSEYVVGGYWIPGYVSSPDYKVEQYVDLITSEHIPRPKFISMIETTVRPFAELSAIMEVVPYLYDVDIAVGSQLDIIGQWVGVGRRLKTPLPNVYFSFNTVGLGLDQGIWKGPLDSETGLTDLTDEYYRVVIKARIINNQWNGSKETADYLLQYLYPSAPFFPFIQDNFDLTMIIGLAGMVSDAVSQALLVQGMLDVKPAGVSTVYMIPSVAGPIFGFDLNNQYVTGFDLGSWGVTDLPYVQNAGAKLGLNFVLGQSVLL